MLQTSHSSGSSPVAQPTVPWMCLCESHSTSRVAVLSQLPPPACTASLKPLPQLFLPTTAGRQKASRGDSQCWISSFLLLPWHHHPTTPLIPTPSPASSAGQEFSPFSITPMICRLPCSLSPEGSQQMANAGGSNAHRLQGTASQLCHSTEPSHTHPS